MVNAEHLTGVKDIHLQFSPEREVSLETFNESPLMRVWCEIFSSTLRNSNVLVFSLFSVRAKDSSRDGAWMSWFGTWRDTSFLPTCSSSWTCKSSWWNCKTKPFSETKLHIGAGKSRKPCVWKKTKVASSFWFCGTAPHAIALAPAWHRRAAETNHTLI